MASPSPRNDRAYHHGDLRRVLVETTLVLLSEQGADALSIREVARRAGVSPMAPYRHFPEKDSLLAAVAAVGFERLRNRLMEGAAAEPERGLETQTTAYVAFAIDAPALFRLMFSPRVEGDYPELIEMREGAYDALRSSVAASAPETEDLEGLLLAHWSLMHGLASLVLDGKLDHKQLGTPDVLAQRAVRAIVASAGR